MKCTKYGVLVRTSVEGGARAIQGGEEPAADGGVGPPGRLADVDGGNGSELVLVRERRGDSSDGDHEERAARRRSVGS